MSVDSFLCRGKCPVRLESTIETSLRTPLQLLQALDLLGDGAPGEKLPWSRVEQFAQRSRAFDWLHLGQTDIEVGQLLDLLRGQPQLLPPRTGHMGNWQDIVQGRAGAMDFNRPSATGGLGYPLIYAFNQTEDASLENGDWVYLPGSLIDRGQRTLLNLHTWDGAAFALRDRSRSLFTPFVMAEANGELQPLTGIHWRRMQKFEGFRFGLEATALCRDTDLLRSILVTLLEDASAQANPRAAFQEVLSHQVGLDGRMLRESVQRVGDGYRMGEVEYPSSEALADAMLLSLQAVSEPDAFFAKIATLPEHMPTMANTLARMLSGFFSTHYPDVPIERVSMTQPFNPHFHWGARDMAGYPPVRAGYFSRKTRARSASKICQAIIRNHAQVDPLLFVLMPAAMFMLCPTTAHERDHAPVDDLIARVRRVVGRGETARGAMQALNGAVRDWLAEVEGQLSGYFLNRFYRRRGVLHAGDLPERSDPLEPVGFRQMTLRQACMTVGALMQALSPEQQIE